MKLGPGEVTILGNTATVREEGSSEVYVLAMSDNTCETYCRDCKQLRLWLKPEKPTACGNCGSSSIETGEIGSERLAELKKARA